MSSWMATLEEDFALFEELGISRFSLRDRGWFSLGTVEFDWASVEIEVICMPAQFWRFTISPKEPDVQAGVLSTGSGSLSDFWPFVDMWVNGLITFQKEKK